MTMDEALTELRRRHGGDLSHVPGPVMMRAVEMLMREDGKHVLVMRGGVAVDLSDVRAVVEGLEQNEEDELYMLQWTEMLSWLRMASTVVSRLGGSMRRLPDETPDGEVWTVMSITQ